MLAMICQSLLDRSTWLPTIGVYLGSFRIAPIKDSAVFTRPNMYCIIYTHTYCIWIVSISEVFSQSRYSLVRSVGVLYHELDGARLINLNQGTYQSEVALPIQAKGSSEQQAIHRQRSSTCQVLEMSVLRRTHISHNRCFCRGRETPYPLSYCIQKSIGLERGRCFTPRLCVIHV